MSHGRINQCSVGPVGHLSESVHICHLAEKHITTMVWLKEADFVKKLRLTSYPKIRQVLRG